MRFDPNLEIGQILNNDEVSNTFGCSTQGGMRKSNSTNTLVLITNYVKGIYHDKWIGGTLHYTGMGLLGDQDINFMQNRTLNESKTNGVDMHLFEVIDPNEYIYCGHVELVDDPYIDIQPDENNSPRKVWMFPIRPIPENNVKKPEMYVFKDLADYKERGQNVDIEFAKLKKSNSRSPKSNAGPKGKRIHHTTKGDGLIKKYDGRVITVAFTSGEVETLNLQFCIDKNLIEFI